jgi:hypothetical protein
VPIVQGIPQVNKRRNPNGATAQHSTAQHSTAQQHELSRHKDWAPLIYDGNGQAAGRTSKAGWKPRIHHVFVLYLVLGYLDFGTIHGAVYYVATYGSNDPSCGQKTAPWKTIAYAASRINPGDTVYVKTGTYGLANDQAAGNYFDSYGITINDSNVQFIGCYDFDNPNTLNNGEGVPPAYGSIYSYETMFPIMPIIEGEDRRFNNGITVAPGRGYVTIKNFWIRNYQQGIKFEVDTVYCSIQNVVGLRFGDTQHVYDGIGFGMYGSGHYINNCIILNSCAEGFSIHATGCLITNCKAYADDNSTGRKSAMDYYFLLCASGSAIPASGNIIRNCDCERWPVPGTSISPNHEGHGFLIQAYTSFSETATNNTIEDCRVKSLGELILLRGKGVFGNRFLRCHSDLTATITNPVGALGCIAISSSRNNTFSRIWLGNSKSAVFITGLEEENDPTANWASEYNTFENCIFHNCEKAIDLSWYHTDNLNVHTDTADGTTQDVRQTSFFNCTFAANPAKTTYFFWSNRQASSNFIVNCIITDFDNYVHGQESEWTQFTSPPYEANDPRVIAGDYYDFTIYPSPGFSFNNCCFWNNHTTFIPAIAAGTGNKIGNPAYSNPVLYELSDNSPCVNSGAPYSFLYPGDYDGTTRVLAGVVDIGAQESPSAFVP